MVDVRTDHRPTIADLNALYRIAWGQHQADRDYGRILDRSLGWVCALEGGRLVGFVNVGWDGGVHALLLDTCVAPDVRRRGIATRMVARAVTLARERGATWLHVDYEGHLAGFYRSCGFRPTHAGLIDLTAK